MAGQYVFTMHGVCKSYGTNQILKDISLSFFPGAKIGVVGENGSGKSTLLRIMAGVEREFEGHAAPEKGVRIGLVAQEPQLDLDATVREHVENAFGETKALLKEFDEVSVRMGTDLSEEEMEKALQRMATLQDAIDAVDGWELDRQIDIASDALVLPPDELKADKLSGGERRRVALCQALLARPDILLLDEPTNHLDAETVAWLEGQLRAYPGTVIIVTHDRYFLDNVTQWILELDNGKGIPFEGNYSSWLEQKLAALTESEKKESERRKSLDRELRWIRMNRNEQREQGSSRIREYEQLFAKEASRAKGSTVIEIPAGERLGDHVLEFDDVSKGYDGNGLIRSATFNLPRGAIVGVLGPNGAGKTTLFRMIANDEKPDSGGIRVGETVQLAHVDQHRDELEDGKTVWEEISDAQEEIIVGSVTMLSRNYVSRFNFKGSDQQKKVGDLSGGERNRVHLAKLIRRGGNFLLLDEPTNDLDVSALRMLEDALLGFSGCAMIISHDRFFLDRVCTHLLVFEGEGSVRWFEGNFRDYEETRVKEAGETGVKGRRARYRKLSL